MQRPNAPFLSLLLTLPCLTSCLAWSGGARTIDTRDGRAISTDQLADALADYDVVFLGEEHDNDVAHELQLAVTEALLERRGDVAISMEMFERDVQNELDFYLLGVTGEERLLERARPWSNYRRHYRPAIQLARRESLDVIAANVPRPVAAQVAREGLVSALGDGWAAFNVVLADPEYRERFEGAMGGHGSLGDRMNDFFAAQVIKDETMAESIADYIESRGQNAPPVVHWCGRFHSDYGLGTVSRLRRRMPHLKIAIVSTVSTGNTRRALQAEERELGDFVWLVPRG